jgi:hypothetical protein
MTKSGDTPRQVTIRMTTKDDNPDGNPDNERTTSMTK